MSYELFCSGEVTSGMGDERSRCVLVMWCFVEFCTGIVPSCYEVLVVRNIGVVLAMLCKALFWYC